MIDQQLNHDLDRNPFPNIVFGDWNNNIVKVELDDCWSKRQAVNIAHMLNKRYNLDGFRIFQSSTTTNNVKDEKGVEVVYKYKSRGYHIVFNREVSPLENHSIVAWLCLVLKNEDLTKWFLMQCIKQTVTLRHGFKGRKHPPKEVYRFGNQDKMIAEFLDNRSFILNFLSNPNC